LLPVAPTLRSGNLDRPVKYRFFRVPIFWPYGTLKEAERYTKAVQQKKVAAGAMNLLVAGRSENESG
jgi:hypothetical protein